jgi:hypothetical protein
MPTERLKFRCYRCSQLLSVAASRAGTVISCPKCKADLLIPAGEGQPVGEAESRTRAARESRNKAGSNARRRAEAQAQGGGDTESGAGEPAEPSSPEAAPWAALSTEAPKPPSSAVDVPDEIAAMIHPDLVDLKPEDLRVEAEFLQSLTRRPPSVSAAEPAAWAPSNAPVPDFSHEVLVSPGPSRPPFEASGSKEAAETAPVSAEPIGVGPGQLVAAAPPAAAGAIAPPIEIEPPSILAPGTEIRRVAEVTLPAPVVLAWSLFVLAGIAMSFIAGLMIGHYLWKMP